MYRQDAYTINFRISSSRSENQIAVVMKAIVVVKTSGIIAEADSTELKEKAQNH